MMFAVSLGGFAQGSFFLVLYAIGASIPLLVTAVLAAQTNKFVVRRVERVTPTLHFLAGGLIIAAGLYLVARFFV